MASNKGTETEEHIKTVARKVFIEKGYDTTTTRDIAAASNTNVALINYYFQSKEKLFNAIFEEVALEFFNTLLQVFNQDIPLRKKFETIIDKDFEFIIENQGIPNFIISQLQTNGEAFFKKFLNIDYLKNSLMFKQIDQAIANGSMRDLKIHECIVLIISNIQFVFLAKPLFVLMGNLSAEDYLLFVKEHKKRVKEMTLNYIFLD
jgi:TetR/AcrR family transcriptional regulator